ncbi:MAG: response regulator [Alphaproteobacteria bacterium]|nr:response regulator [Alphaproteobacteria bacterium]
MRPDGSADPIYILAPVGRDGPVIAAMLRDAGIAAEVIREFADPEVRLEDGAGLVVASEAFERFDPAPLHAFLAAQPPWSDFPIVFLRTRGQMVTPQTQTFIEGLGNVTILERPLHPISLVSAGRSAVRARRRQREAEALLAERLRINDALRHSEEQVRALADQLERRVQERTAELAAANRQLLAEMAERERMEATMLRMQRLEAVGQLTAGVAHDFNNLLTVILGNLTRLEREAAPADRRRFEMMRAAAERGAMLTAQLLAFSRRQKLEPKAVNLNDAIQSLRDLLQTTLGAAFHLSTRLEAAAWPAMVDPTQIEMVILNLAINARDAMEAGGEICVQTGNAVVTRPRIRPEEPEPGEYVVLSVRDGGCGMDEDTLGRVFEPFFTTKEVGRGSGLGLSQVLGFAKQSGGGVQIETQVGAGTTVKVYLPRAAAHPTSAGPSLVVDGLGASVKGGTILLVDDDEAVRETTASTLESLGFKVIEAGSGGSALEILDSRRKIDLLLLDFAMPGMNGADVARAAQSRRPNLPILFVTGYADLTAMTHIAEHQVIRKPFEERELARRVAGALGGPEDAEELGA